MNYIYTHSTASFTCLLVTYSYIVLKFYIFESHKCMKLPHPTLLFSKCFMDLKLVESFWYEFDERHQSTLQCRSDMNHLMVLPIRVVYEFRLVWSQVTCNVSSRHHCTIFDPTVASGWGVIGHVRFDDEDNNCE